MQLERGLPARTLQREGVRLERPDERREVRFGFEIQIHVQEVQSVLLRPMKTVIHLILVICGFRADPHTEGLGMPRERNRDDDATPRGEGPGPRE